MAHKFVWEPDDITIIKARKNSKANAEKRGRAKYDAVLPEEPPRKRRS